MHPRERRTDSDDFHFLERQLVEPCTNLSARSKQFREADVGRVVPRFALKEAGIKIGQFGIGNMLAEELKAFAATGLDQRGDEQPIDPPLRFVGGDQRVELPPVGPRGKSSERNLPLVQAGKDHLVMLQFLDDNPRHLLPQLAMIGVGTHQAHCHRRRFPLAVSMIDEDLGEMGVDLREPAKVGCRLQMKHRATLVSTKG